MAFPPGFLDELRGRIPLTELVGRRVNLVRRGREFAGLCPFHNEKTPSFYVVEDKGFFHCFGCGAHGDAIGFVMRADNLDFLEAVEKLASGAGLAVPQATPEERQKARRQKTLLEILEAAVKFYEERLWSPVGRAARDYLTHRGLDATTIRRFRLGWAPDDRSALRRALAGDMADPLLLEAGLLHRPAEGEPFDYFRGRIMFPIGDRAGRVIAFGGRVLGDVQPKYLNSPDTPVFDKGRVLYGWSAARAAAAAEPTAAMAGGRNAVVVEGYMDVIALHQAGFATAVAPLGTALGEYQLQGRWRLGPEPVLCFDGDAAGQRAAVRALRRALPLLRPGHSLRVARLPSGDDPDTLIRRGGSEAFAQVLVAALPLSQMLWEGELAAAPADTPERRADLDRRLSEAVATILDPVVRNEYRRFVRNRLYEVERPHRRPPGPAALRPHFVRDGPAPPPRAAGRVQRMILFRIVLESPLVLEEVAEEFAAIDIPEAELDKLRREILEIAVLRPGLDASELRQHLLASRFSATVDALLSPSVDSGFMGRRPTMRDARNEWAHVIAMLQGGRRTPLTEASAHLIEELSTASWERFLAAREWALRHGPGDDDQV
jgi:DNA primase